MTHDHKRHGVTTLFAALNTLDGGVVGQCHKTPAPGMGGLPAQVDCSTPSDYRQLRNPQAPGGAGVAGEARENSRTFDASQYLLASQYGRT
jgi:hypothetical protein